MHSKLRSSSESTPNSSIGVGINSPGRVGDARIAMLQEPLRLQKPCISRTEEVHAEQIRQLEELRDEFAKAQEQNAARLHQLELDCALDASNLAGVIQICQTTMDFVSELANHTNNNGRGMHPAIEAFLECMQNIRNFPGKNTTPCSPLSGDERIRFKVGKRKLSCRMRTLLTLAEQSSSSPTKSLEGTDAEDFIMAMEDIVEIMQDQSKVGAKLRRETPQIAVQQLRKHQSLMQN
ncbi:hypothetical protein Dda_6183 [Drechslerella dactyloides]|uniref:Uncharacterized protein n=1 Tax=Drechslerella dactyloides TaxID=74499 RepID=A0AAD6NI85_DREDA|nr:hypothetical protein Dda_6183 [Drechslerella dactyloides]